MQVSWLRNYQWVGGGVHTTTWVKRKAGRRTIPAPRGSPAPQPTWGIIVRKRLFPTTKRIWKHFWCLTARQGQLCLTLWTLTVLSGTKANECCSVAAVQLLEVTDGQFGFLQLDFDQVAFIAPQLQEDNSTTMQRKWKHCESCDMRAWMKTKAGNQELESQRLPRHLPWYWAPLPDLIRATRLSANSLPLPSLPALPMTCGVVFPNWAPEKTTTGHKWGKLRKIFIPEARLPWLICLVRQSIHCWRNIRLRNLYNFKNRFEFYSQLL